MNEQVRLIRPADTEALASLWARVFGDPEELARAFLRLLPGMGFGLCAEQDGAVVGMAYMVTGLELLEPGRSRSCAYLYAVAVEERCRGLGLGRELTQEAARLARERGAELLCTLPASPSLYGWYEGLIGLRRALSRRRRELSPSEPLPLEPLSAEEYGRRREALLAGLPHLRPNAAALAFQEELLRCYGGGFYALPGGLAAAYREEGALLVRELLCAPASDAARLAAGLGAALGAEGVRLFEPAAEGEPYLAADTALPAGTVWNLSFD